MFFNNIMYKIDKYINKLSNNDANKNKYVKKLAQNIVKILNTEMSGGGEKKIIDEDLESLFEHIKEKIKDKDTKTKNKYMVILYGPPSSGKTLARKIACRKIKEEFSEENFTEKQIFNSFIDSGVDEIIYDFVSKDQTDQKSTQELMKEKYGTINKNITESDIKQLVKENIVNIAENSFEEYKKNKTKGDSISDMVKFLSVFLGMNLFIETASWNSNYWNKFLGAFESYGYIPIVIYPFTTKSELLYNRSIDRGIKEYRFLTYDRIKTMAEQAKDNFMSAINNIRLIYTKDLYVFVYDTHVLKNTYESINEFKFDNINFNVNDSNENKNENKNENEIKVLYTLKTSISGSTDFTKQKIE